MASDTDRSNFGDLLLSAVLIAGLVVLLVLDVGSPPDGMEHSPLEGLLKQIVGYVALVAEAGAALVIAAAVLRGLWECLVLMVRGNNRPMHATEYVRLRLGRLLVLGLEFTVAADILGMAIAPSRESLTVLAIVLLVRTFLSLILEREVRSLEERHGDLDDDADPA